ncbi:MAG: helix-turn-helix domain-containing protein [Candidatus Pristimantibacillus lignocellulolyticus]|uniref:Helix-turn-helix domain-containing protein n=1 Tax=Candidatus Pristimantibacillus lignocellulolyticus TaxID=2994561 RepID=A0A9J6ZFH2_9BACL|nr:MAG: helix-turn-helix domain-containing protein [Candidatus Pristimantibacillus lignocellulolyticus]
MDIGESIKLLRKKHGFTGKQLAELSGVTRATIGHIERGRHKPSIDTVELLLQPFGLRLTIKEK